jgi:tetratricopeptide (TPR) repeat protein
MRRGVWLTWCVLVFLAATAAGTVLSRHVLSGAGRGDRSLAESLTHNAMRAWQAGGYSQVVERLVGVPETDPLAARARVFQGRALVKLHRWQLAENAWTSALELPGVSPEAADAREAVWELLEMYFILQAPHASEELLSRTYPRQADRLQRKALLLELVRQEFERMTPAETVLNLEPVAAREPENHRVTRALGLSYVQLGRVHEGLELLQSCITLQPDDPDGWFALVWSLHETGATQQLDQVWQQMPEGMWRDARLWRYRGMHAEAAGDWPQAEQAYRAAIERDAADRKAHYQLARVLNRRGEQAEAREHQSAARTLDETREALAACYTRSSQLRDDPPAELCAEFGRLLRGLGRQRQAELWEQESQQPVEKGDSPSTTMRNYR